MTLNELVGKHTLDAVDFESTETANAIRFRLDGILYVATEDEEDGYRSCLRDIYTSIDPAINAFEPIEVLAMIGVDRDDNVLQLIDTSNGKLVLEVGTTEVSDYYPSFVANFIPENMSINSSISPSL